MDINRRHQDLQMEQVGEKAANHVHSTGGKVDIKIGESVAFKKGLYEDEEGAVYRVLEINGDRCILELENTSLAIRPQSVAMLSDLAQISRRDK